MTTYMFFDLFKKKSSEKEALHTECKAVVRFVQEADELTRVAIGHSINMAHSFFRQNYANVEAFQNASIEERNQLIVQLTKMVEGLVQKDQHAAIGFRMFSIWIVGLTANDTSLTSQIEPIMEELSREGNLG